MKARTPRLAERATAGLLRAIRVFDRWRLRLRAALLPGLEIHPGASTNFAAARFRIAPGARLTIGAGAVTERHPGALSFALDPGAVVTVGEGVWLRTEVERVHIAAHAGGRIDIGPGCFLNGCSISAKSSVTLGTRASVGVGSRVYDADQHDFDADHPERVEPVSIGEYAWVASDVTIMRGVSIGAHSVVGARSLVTQDVPPHALAFGTPARVRGKVGDRSTAR